MRSLLLIPLLAWGAADDGNPPPEVISRAVEVAGLGRSFVVFEPSDMMAKDGTAATAASARRAPTAPEGGSDDSNDDAVADELTRCWNQYRTALDAARAALARAMATDGGGLRLPEPGSEGAKRVSAVIGEIDAAGQRLLADSCMPESARRTLLRRAVVRILSDGRYRHDPLLSCTGVDAALDLESASREPARMLRERLKKDEAARERLEEALRRFEIAATELRRTALAAGRASDVAESRSIERANPDEVARARQRALEVPRAWWREQQTFMDQVQAIASEHEAAAPARRWRMDVVRESFPAFVPAVDLEETLRSTGVDPTALEIEGWGAFWLGFQNDRDAAAITLIDRALEMAESQHGLMASSTPDLDGAPLRARIDALTKAGALFSRLETTAATRAAELLGESHANAVPAVIDYLGQIDRRASSSWKGAAERSERHLAALEKHSSTAGHPAAPDEDQSHEPEPPDPNGPAR